MTTLPEWKHLIPDNFDDNSRVWIYQGSRIFGLSEALQLESILEDFVENWKSHGTPVKGYANLLFGQFVVFMADETAAGVSGCSTDSSVRVVKEIENLFGTSMFDRLTLAFIKESKVQMLPLQQINYAIENGFINQDTIYFNNLVQTKKDLLNNWLVPVKNSWLASRLKPVTV
ncbi:hypothetical protein BH10BAC3_BH10BAC3_11370 [soil metagenome]